MNYLALLATSSYQYNQDAMNSPTIMTSILNYHVTGNSELTYMHVSGQADPESLQEGYMY